MANLRNKRKFAAVLRGTPEITRNSQSRNTLDPEMAQEYVSQVSEVIEGRVTKKFSKGFSRTESRILGALSKLDEFLLNPQVLTISVAVPGISKKNNSRNWEPNGVCSPNDPCPEVMISSNQLGKLNNSEVEDYPHSCGAYCLDFSSFMRKSTARMPLTISHFFNVRKISTEKFFCREESENVENVSVKPSKLTSISIMRIQTCKISPS